MELFSGRISKYGTIFCIVAFSIFTIIRPSHAQNSPPPQGNIYTEEIFITLQGSNMVESLQKNEVWRGLPNAHYVALSPDSSEILVSSASLPQAYLVDAISRKKLATFDVGPVAQGVQFSPDGKLGLAVSEKNGTVSVIDIEKLRVIKTISVGTGPHNAHFTADGKIAYVTLQEGSGVAVLDMETLTKVDEFPTPGLDKPHNLDISADGKVLWIRGFLGKVAAVNLASRKVLAVIPVGASHAGIDVIPGGKYVFTGGIGGSTVGVVNPDTFKVVKIIEVGAGPHGVRASSDGRFVYVGVVKTNEIVVIDTQSLEIISHFPAQGKTPFWIAVAGNN